MAIEKPAFAENLLAVAGEMPDRPDLVEVDAADPHAQEAGELADAFCRRARRRIAERHRALRQNDDVRNYRTAQRLLEGRYAVLTETMPSLAPASGRRMVERPAEVEAPAARSRPAA